MDKTPRAARKVTGAHFCGHAGEFIAGIPPRDLTGEEWNALAPDLQKLAIDSGLYELTTDAPKETN